MAEETNQEKQEKLWRIEKVDYLPSRWVRTLYKEILEDFISSGLAIGKVIVDRNPTTLFYGLRIAISRMALSHKIKVRRIANDVYLVDIEKTGIFKR
jgi:hypothetical protein